MSSVIDTLISFADELITNDQIHVPPTPPVSQVVPSLFEMSLDAMIKAETDKAPLPLDPPDLPDHDHVFPDVPVDMDELPCKYPENWNQLSLMEKIRLYNIYKNTATLHSLGLASYFDKTVLTQGHCTTNPVSLKRKRVQRNLEAEQLSTDLGVLIDDCIRGASFVK